MEVDWEHLKKLFLDQDNCNCTLNVTTQECTHTAHFNDAVEDCFDLIVKEREQLLADKQKLRRELDEAKNQYHYWYGAYETYRKAFDAEDADLKIELLKERIAILEAQLKNTKEWECPECLFRFNAEHTLADGTYSCPLCELTEKDAEIAKLKQANDYMMNKRIEPAEALERIETKLEKEAFDAGFKHGLLEKNK